MNTSPIVDSELDADIAKAVKDFCEQGYLLFDQGDYSAAIRQFYSAWTQLPKPQTRWQEAGWVLTALGDAYFAKGDFDNGNHALRSALHCPKAAGNPVIHLRLGQCLFEMNDRDGAREQFQLVRDNGGDALFNNEDPKYGALG